MATKKRSAAKGTGTGKVEKVMHEYKEGTLKSGGRAPVKSRKQAVAIALSETRRAGANIPAKKSSKKTAAKKAAAKKSPAKKSAAKKSPAKKIAKKVAAKKATGKNAARKR